MPAYRAEQTLEKTVADIPSAYTDSLILVDDASPDNTAQLARSLGIKVFVHPENRGYGGNQKTCYSTALADGAEVVVMLHPDYQYDPRAVPLLIAPILAGDADMTFGSRFAGLGDPMAGGMPLYRFIGNRLTTIAENLMLGSRFTEMHSGMRAYTKDCLESLPFLGYSDDFAFDSQLLVDAVTLGQRVVEVPIPCRYTKESSSISVARSLKYIAQGLAYCRKRTLERGRRGSHSPVAGGQMGPDRIGTGEPASHECVMCGATSCVELENWDALQCTSCALVQGLDARAASPPPRWLIDLAAARAASYFLPVDTSIVQVLHQVEYSDDPVADLRGARVEGQALLLLTADVLLESPRGGIRLSSRGGRKIALTENTLHALVGAAGWTPIGWERIPSPHDDASFGGSWSSLAEHPCVTTLRAVSRRTVVVLLLLFLVTRVFNQALAGNDTNYVAAFGDLQKYEQWATAISDQDLEEYSEVPIEYPPGVIPFMVAAQSMRAEGDEYGRRFIWVMAVLDALGFAALMLLARRGGSVLGPLMWIFGALLLGPIVYLRLDLIPAVATILSILAASLGAWFASGGLLIFGAIAKVYPVFLIPAMAVVARDRKGFLLGAGVVGAVLMLPYLFDIRELSDNVLGYHSDRGIQVESTWGSLLLAASAGGYDAFPNFQFGANEMVSGLTGAFKKLGLLLSGASFIIGTFAIGERVARDDLPRLTAALTGMLALLMGFGTVLSPQFMIWLIALGAAALCFPQPTRVRWIMMLILPCALLTQIVFPYTIDDVLRPFYEGETSPGSPFGLGTLLVRNVLLLGIGGALVYEVLGRGSPEPAPEEDDAEASTAGSNAIA